MHKNRRFSFRCSRLHSPIRTSFLQELLERDTPAGGFAAYGAACTAQNLCKRSGPTFTAIVKGGADAAKSMNCPWAQIPPFIQEQWQLD
jgi:hypothetical protein